MPVLSSGETEAQQCEGAHTRPCTAPVAKSLGCRGQTAHKPAVIQSLLGIPRPRMGQGKGGSKEVKANPSPCVDLSAQLLSVTTWKRAVGEGELGTIWSLQHGDRDRKEGKGGKEAAAPPRHLTPTWGWFGPIPCTRARSSFGTGPTCPGKSRAGRRGQNHGLSLW